MTHHNQWQEQKNIVGRTLLDENLNIRLEFDSKDEFLLTQSGALYLRELSASGIPQSKWIERPIQNLPRFNDYISDFDDVWVSTSVNKDKHPLLLSVSPISDDDPLQQDLQVTSYLRYAFLQPKFTDGGVTLSPTAWITLRKGDVAEQNLQMFAFNPAASSADASLIAFKWLETTEELEALQQSLAPSTICHNWW